MLGPLEQYMTPTLDAALLSSSRASAEFYQLTRKVKGYAQLKGRAMPTTYEKGGAQKVKNKS